MEILVYIICSICAAEALLPKEVLDQEWAQFKKAFKPRHSSIDPQENLRRQIFDKNLELITAHNERYKQGLETYQMAINSLSDRTPEELAKLTMKPNIENPFFTNSTEIKDPILTPRGGIPDAFDWRNHGVITPVKNQESCGSCWAFATVGALEAHYKIRHRETVILSEQHMVDCVPDGCEGGSAEAAFSFINRFGVHLERDYHPYVAKEHSCRTNNVLPRVTIRGYQVATNHNEEQLKIAVATRGPVVVTIYANPDQLCPYCTGVYYIRNCNHEPNHAVLVVGYGSENGEDYWIIKNSWGDDWGDKGYFKLARNKGNNCGVADTGFLPVL